MTQLDLKLTLKSPSFQGLCFLFGGQEKLLSRHCNFSLSRFLLYLTLYCLCMNLKNLPNSYPSLLPRDIQLVQSCPTLCNPMNRSTPGIPVHHHLLEFTQTQVHLVNDAIQPSHPQSSPSPHAFNLSQHQGLISKESALHIR